MFKWRSTGLDDVFDIIIVEQAEWLYKLECLVPAVAKTAAAGDLSTVSSDHQLTTLGVPTLG